LCVHAHILIIKVIIMYCLRLKLFSCVVNAQLWLGVHCSTQSCGCQYWKLVIPGRNEWYQVLWNINLKVFEILFLRSWWYFLRIVISDYFLLLSITEAWDVCKNECDAMTLFCILNTGDTEYCSFPTYLFIIHALNQKEEYHTI
jgi:hypothetical protein